MKPETARQIEISDPFIFVNDSGWEGTEGEDHLRYAVALKKHILVLRTPENSENPLPYLLNDYKDYDIVDGGDEELKDALIAYWNAAAVSEVRIHEASW